MYLSPRKKLFVETASKMFGVNATISKQNVREAAAEAGVPFPSWFIKGFKAHYGHFTLPLFEGAVAPASAVSAPTESLNTTVNLVASTEIENLVPTKLVHPCKALQLPAKALLLTFLQPPIFSGRPLANLIKFPTEVHRKKNLSNQNGITIKSCIKNIIVNLFILV